jgi:hypothetical protein
MPLRLILSACTFAFFFSSCKNFEKPLTAKRDIYIKLFNWTITIPPGYDTISAKKWAAMQTRGKKAIEETFDTKIENRTKTILVLQKGPTNYIEANYQFFDSTVDGNYKESCEGVYKVLFKTFEQNIKGWKLDSISSLTKVSGLRFYTFKVKMTSPKGQNLNMTIFNRLFGKKDFTVSLMGLSEKDEKELMNAWMNSKFE